MQRPLLGFLVVAAIILSGQRMVHTQSSRHSVPTTPLIREKQEISINGIPEVWRLQWKSPPKPSCGPDDPDFSITCPCTGFAYGETGQLDLLRIRRGREIDRLKLTPLFEGSDAGQDGAVVQRWEPREEDSKALGKEGFPASVRTRPIVKIMQFADFNHDGYSTEFFLQTDTLPCGKVMGVVVGLTPSNPWLHLFGTSLHPDKPLVMQKREWMALLKSSGPIEVRDWPCGDHGAETESAMRLSTTSAGIRAILREFECTETGNRGRLIGERTL